MTSLPDACPFNIEGRTTCSPNTVSFAATCHVDSSTKPSTTADLPVVGDWVVLAPRPDDNAGTITAVLPRFTKFSRKTAWQAAEEQVLAANIDVAFLVASMNEDLSLRRLERYLILAWESGARPVIVLTKADLHAVPGRPWQRSRPLPEVSR